MAKRFYDTGLVDQEWYMNLSTKHKALYMHLLCKCDIAGVFEANFRMMSFYVGDTITEEDVFGAFGNRVIPLANSESKGIMVDFVCFQCGGCINPKVKAHRSILKRLDELNISVDELKSWCNHDLRIAENNDPQIQEEKENASASIPEKEHGEAESASVAEEKSTSKMIAEWLFNSWWAAYPRHDGKKTAHDKFVRLMLNEGKTQNGMEDLYDKLAKAVAVAKRSDQWTKDGGQFIPMPSTWLNQRRWEDEGVESSAEAMKNKANSEVEEIAKRVLFSR